MSDAAVKSIQDLQIAVSTTVQDVYSFLLRLLDEKDAFIKDKDFLNAIKQSGKTPAFLTMEHAAMKRLCKELEKKGIPYMLFDVAGTSKDVLMLRPSDVIRVKNIENGMRIQAGLEIDTKEELDRALALTEKDAKEVIIKGLTEYEANRIVHFSNKKDKFTVVAYEESDRTFSVASHEKNTDKLHEYAVIAITENENKSPQAQQAIASASYLAQQKREFLSAIEEIRDRGITQEAYLLSLTKDNYYIHINPRGFEIVDRGIVTHAMEMKSNPELYADVLKFLGEDIESPVFKLNTEMKEAGGVKNVLNAVREKIGTGTVPKAYPEDTAFKKWIVNNFATGEHTFGNEAALEYTNIEQFISYYQSTEHKTLSEEKIAVLTEQLDRIKGRLMEAHTNIEKPQVGLDDIMANEGLNPSLGERLYSEEEIRRVQNGDFQFSDDNIKEEERRLRLESTRTENRQPNQMIAEKQNNEKSISDREKVLREKMAAMKRAYASERGGN